MQDSCLACVAKERGIEKVVLVLAGWTRLNVVMGQIVILAQRV